MDQKLVKYSIKKGLCIVLTVICVGEIAQVVFVRARFFAWDFEQAKHVCNKLFDAWETQQYSDLHTFSFR